MAMTSNPTTSAIASANFNTPDKLLTHLGRYLDVSGKLVALAYDPASRKINVDNVSTGAVAPTVVFRPYEQLRLAFYGKNLMRLGAFADATGTAQAWYDPVANIVYVDTTT